MAEDFAELKRRLAELQATHISRAPAPRRDVEVICRACGESKNPSKYEISDESEVCYRCSAKRLRLREVLQFAIPGALAFIAAVYDAHDGGECGPGSLPGCVVVSSTIVAIAVFFGLYFVLAD